MDGYIDEIRLSDVVLTVDQFLFSANASVPEPSSLLLLASGLVGLFLFWTRRCK